MDKSLAGSSRRHRVALAPCLEHLEGRRLLSVNASKISIQESTSNGSPALIITGTNLADIINISDNGSGTAGNITVSLGDGSTYTTQGAIAVIEVLGKGGNDQVSYNLTGDLVATRAVLVDLGNGNDQFTANVTSAIDDSAGLDLEAYGDSGNDNLVDNQSGPILSGTFLPYLDGGAGNDTLTYNGTGDISAGAAISPALSGDSGNDTITSDYAGKIDGDFIYNLTIDGGAGNDTIIDNVNMGAGSTGTVGSDSAKPAVIEGGTGNDQIRFAVAVDPSATQSQVNALVIGAPGRDTVQRTSNVQGNKSNENDSVLT